MHFIAIIAAALTMQLAPGLNPVGGDGVRVDAAVLVSTNAVATSSVAAVYDLPVWGEVEVVSSVTNDVLTTVTNLVEVEAYSAATTSLYRVSYVFGQAVTNYYTLTTNAFVTLEPRPGEVVTTTSAVSRVTGHASVTNDILSLTASGGFAETNGVGRCLAPGAKLLLTGAPVTIFLE